MSATHLLLLFLCGVLVDAAVAAITAQKVDTAIRLVQEELNLIYNRYEVSIFLVDVLNMYHNDGVCNVIGADVQANRRGICPNATQHVPKRHGYVGVMLKYRCDSRCCSLYSASYSITSFLTFSIYNCI
jgi:hypothetical protein